MLVSLPGVLGSFASLKPPARLARTGVQPPQLAKRSGWIQHGNGGTLSEHRESRVEQPRGSFFGVRPEALVSSTRVSPPDSVKGFGVREGLLVTSRWRNPAVIGIAELVILLFVGMACLGVPILVGSFLFMLVRRDSSRQSAETQPDRNPPEAPTQLDR